MNRIAIIGAALAFAGCVDIGLTDVDKSGDTGCPAEPGVVEIESIDINCDTTTQVTFTVNTVGVAADGNVFSQETGNATPNYSDNHTLAFDSSDACGQTSVLTRTLTTDTSLANAQPDSSTVFSCAADTHYAADVMTYAFHIFDDGGNELDCLVAGNNPSDLIDGASDRVNEPTYSVADCATGSIAAY